jgi:hypothetical protein
MRALILGMLLTDAQQALYGLDAELDTVGVGREMPAVGGWEARLETAEESDYLLRQLEVENPEAEWRSAPSDRPYLDQRTAMWERAADSSDPADAIAWQGSLWPLDLKRWTAWQQRRRCRTGGVQAEELGFRASWTTHARC